MLALLSTSPFGFGTRPTSNTTLPGRMTYSVSSANSVGHIGATQNYVLIARDKECSSGDDFIETVPTVMECAARCEARAGCRYFVHGKPGSGVDGNCYYEHTLDACHTDMRGRAANLQTDDKYDFFMALPCPAGQSCRRVAPWATSGLGNCEDVCGGGFSHMVSGITFADCNAVRCGAQRCLLREGPQCYMYKDGREITSSQGTAPCAITCTMYKAYNGGETCTCPGCTSGQEVC